MYGAQIEEFVPLDAGGPLTKQALAQGTIDVGLVFSSDGGVSALDLVVLEDDKALQTVDNLVPALSERAATPQNIAALNRLAATLTTEDLIELNRQVDIERRDPQEVAAEYLQAKGLVAASALTRARSAPVPTIRSRPDGSRPSGREQIRGGAPA